MTNTQALKDLLVRVEEATGPNREMDGRIQCVAEGVNFRKPIRAKDIWNKRVITGWRTSGGDKRNNWAPLYTDSVSSALAFMREHFTGYVIMKHDLTYSSAELCRRRGYGQDICCGFNERPDEYLPLAIIAATLKALIAEKADA